MRSEDRGWLKALSNLSTNLQRRRFWKSQVGHCILRGGLAVFLLIVTVKAGVGCPFELPMETVSINGHRLIVALAGTPDARACGLSHRSMLPADHGMLFIYERSGPLQFWMKDTAIALSIAFLDASGTIINILPMQPYETSPRYRSQRPAMYALEVNQGWFAERNIVPGDRVILPLH